MLDSSNKLDNIIEICKRKSKYNHMYIPIGNMENVIKNNTYLFDYRHDIIFETKMKSFTILHFDESCKCEPSNVTYMLYCPLCSKYGQDSVTASYLKTNYQKLRFYLTHSRNDCFLINPTNNKKCNLFFNLLCDNCYEPI